MNGSDRISGVILIAAAAGLVILWTRGQLNGLTSSLMAAAQGKAVSRPFTRSSGGFGAPLVLPDPSLLGGGGTYA